MKRLTVVKKELYSFDKKGMVFPSRAVKGGFYVRALDIVLYNHYFMSENEIERCLCKGIEFEWCYNDKELTILNNKKSNLLKFRKLQLNSIYGKKDR